MAGADKPPKHKKSSALTDDSDDEYWKGDLQILGNPINFYNLFHGKRYLLILIFEVLNLPTT